MNPPSWHRTKGTRGGVEYQLLYNVALSSFYFHFLQAEFTTIGPAIDLGLLTLIQS